MAATGGEEFAVAAIIKLFYKFSNNKGIIVNFIYFHLNAVDGNAKLYKNVAVINTTTILFFILQHILEIHLITTKEQITLAIQEKC
jgi:hypothetical protein